MKRKTLLGLLIFAGLAALGFAAFMCYQRHHSGYIDGRAAVRIMYSIEAQGKIDTHIRDFRFGYDTSVLPSTSSVMLDSVIAVIKDYEREGFWYLFRVHSHQHDRSNAEEITYSQGLAEAIKRYVVTAGISPEIIRTVGVGREERVCFDGGEPGCFHQNNRLEIQID